MNNIDQIRTELTDLRHAGEDVQSSNSQTFDTNIIRFVELLSTETFIGELINTALPKVDFNDWYSEASSNRIIIWPTNKTHRLAMQLEVLRFVSSDPRQGLVYDFCIAVLSNDGRLEYMIQTFIQQVFNPFYRGIIALIETQIPKNPNNINKNLEIKIYYVALERIEALKQINNQRFDLNKLIRLCEELNVCFSNNCYYSTAMIVRAIIDHVHPIFGLSSFNEIANNYNGPKSFKDSMSHLSGSARKIGDTHLHVPVRSKEVLPTATQVNFSNDLDVLLAEIIRITS